MVNLRVGMRHRHTPQYTTTSGWTDTFSFDLTYHEHLFWNLQTDVYQFKTLRPRQHVGRYEARISQIEFSTQTQDSAKYTSAHPFPSYTLHRLYDLKAKSSPTINFRILGLKTALEENSRDDNLCEFPVIGGVEMTVRYEHLAHAHTPTYDAPGSSAPVLRDSLLLNGSLGSELDEEDASRSSLQTPSITSCDTPSPSQSASAAVIDTATVKQIVLDDQKVTWIETMSRLVMGERDHQVLRELKFISSGFGQGLDISAISMGIALILLQRFYDLQPQIFTNNLILRKEDLDLPRHLYRFTLATLGWQGLNFFGKGQGFLADYWRDQASYRALLDYLSIPESDLLVFNLEEDKVFRPGFFVCIDRSLSAVILAIRGTMSARDAMTDLVCEYVPFKNGIVHSGFLKSSQWFFDNIGRQLLMFAEEYGLENIYCVGHSLGGATAALTCMHIHDYFSELRDGWPHCTVDPHRRINLHCYAYGTPPTVSEAILRQYDHLIDIYINGDDVVPCLSFGSVLDMHLMVSYAASIANASHLFRSIESTPIMDRLQHCRDQIVGHSNRINPKLFILGRIHHIVSLAAPNNTRYRLIETVDPERFLEIKMTSRSVMQHMPDRYEKALDEAYATFLRSEREERVHLADQAIGNRSGGVDEGKAVDAVDEGEAVNSVDAVDGVDGAPPDSLAL